MFRYGCALIGDLVRAGNGAPLEQSPAQRPDISALAKDRKARNCALLESLREDSHSKDLLAMAIEDARRERMTMPAVLRPSDMEAYTLSPRFCIEQGASPSLPPSGGFSHPSASRRREEQW